jgi:hypothetical protein
VEVREWRGREGEGAGGGRQKESRGSVRKREEGRGRRTVEGGWRGGRARERVGQCS